MEKIEKCPDDVGHRRTYEGLGYKIGKNLTTGANARGFRIWKSLIKRVMSESLGYTTTVNISRSWECLDNFLEWFNKQEIIDTDARLFLVVNPDQLRPRKGGSRSSAKGAKVCPKFSAKTSHLTTIPLSPFRKPSSEEYKDWESEDKRTTATHKGSKGEGMPAVPVSTKSKLYGRKIRAKARHREHMAAMDERREENKVSLIEKRRRKWEGYITDRDHKKYFDEVVRPATEAVEKELYLSTLVEQERIHGIDDIDIRILYRGRFSGLGYVGEGKHRTRIKGKKTKAYRVWEWLLNKCYGSGRSSKDGYDYVGYRVCKKWQCFQNFAKWFAKQEMHGDRLPVFALKPNSKGKLVIGPKNTKLMF